jgi:Raf kinase inhibitor-like YbhB/YbcL family protein
MKPIEIRSQAFNDQDAIPDRFSRKGGNVSPPLQWRGVPEEAAELVLMVEDPDAPGEEPFLHWLVTGIEPHDVTVPEGSVPPGGQEWMNSFGDRGWGGPQPPAGHGRHRYFFRLYALPQRVSLPKRPHTTDVHRALDGREVASGTLMGTFAR